MATALKDLTKCWTYNNPAPPCTRCLATHYNHKPYLVGDTWMYLCRSCLVVVGILEDIEEPPEPKLTDKRMREIILNTTLADIQSAPSFSAWLDSVFGR